MADHHFLPADESANVRSVGQCWTLSPEVGEGSYWIYAKKDLYDIKIHDFLFYEDCFLEFPMPECLSITQYESISGEEALLRTGGFPPAASRLLSAAMNHTKH